METPQQTKPQMIAKFFINDLKGILNRKNLYASDDKLRITMDYLFMHNNLPYMLDMLYDGYIDRQTMKLWVMESCDTVNEILDFMESAKTRMVEATT